MKLKILLFCILLISSACGKKLTPHTTGQVEINSYETELKISNTKLFVEVASTNEQKNKGLSGRKQLQENQGMLFIFSPETKPTFWMKDMLFNIDIIWIKKNKIVYINSNVPAPNSECLSANSSCPPLPTYFPPVAVDKVLETNAGWAKNNNIKIGDTIEVKIK
jgi:uncharacterized membrane protein (UPF0127 family)